MMIPGYILGESVHRSAQADVYRAVRSKDDRRVIIKSVNARDEAVVARCRNHYDLTSTLTIAGVVRSIDFIQTTSHVHLVMDDAGPMNLRDLIAKGSMSIRDMLLYAEQLAAALDAMHSHHVLHRDLNPANVILDPLTQVAVIADLGLAVRVPAASPFYVTEKLEGTLAYMAPEQTGRVQLPIDARSDLYALGCVFYDMLCGAPPFVSADALEVIHAQIARTPTPIVERRFDVPAALIGLIETLLQKDPERRYATAYGVKRDVTAIRASLDSNATVTLRSDDRSDRFTIRQNLYGRSRELDILRTAHAAVQTPRIQAVIVRGTAGSGKTSILRSFERESRVQGSIVLTGKNEQFGIAMPLASIMQAITRFVRTILREPQHVVEQWSSCLQRALGANASLVVQSIPELHALVPAVPDGTQSGAHETKVRLYTALAALLGEIADRCRSLIIVIDDLQWADGDTFELLSTLGSEIAGKPVLILCTVRSEESLAEGHPLHTWTDPEGATPFKIQTIDVFPLGSEAVTELVADTFSIDEKRARELATAIQRRTGGNPLFSWQLLSYMVNEGIVYFDRTLRQWTWDVARLDVMPSQFDVRELIAARFEQLDPAARRYLAIAACIGTSFTIDRLLRVTGDEREPVIWAIDQAMANGLLTWGDASMSDVFEFVHDRTQQVAHAAIPRADVPFVHASISATYVRADGSIDPEDLLTVAGHIELSLETLTDANAKRAACITLFHAGHRAVAQGAIQVARRLIDLGRSLEDDSLWSSHHDILVRASLEYAECMGALGMYEAVDTIIADVIPHCTTPLEVARAKYLHLKILTVQGRFDEVLDVGIDALKHLDIDMPRTPSRLYIVGKLIRTLIAVHGKTPAAIAMQPFSTDDRIRLATEILFGLTSPGFNFSVDLLSSIVLLRTLLVLRHGHSDVSVDVYAMLGLVLGGMKMYRRAATFAQLSIELAARTDDPGARIRAHNTSAGNILIWTRPVTDCIEQFRLGTNVAVASGEQHGTLWALGIQGEQILFSGHALSQVAAYNAQAVLLLHRVYQRTSGLPWTATYFESAVQKVIRAVAPDLPRVKDFDDVIDNGDDVLHHMMKSKDATAVCSWLLADLEIAVLQWESDKALSVYENFTPWKHALAGQALLIEREFYGGLAAAQALVTSANGRTSSLRRMLSRAVATFTSWRKGNADNFEARLRLLEGTRHIAYARYDQAMASLSLAGAAARQTGDLRLHALALEWSVIAIERSAFREAASIMRNRAAAAYRAWGATVLADRLMVHDELRPSAVRMDRPTITQTLEADSVGMTQASIDIDTVLKASGAISSSLVFEDLMRDMMRIVLENAGADRAVLLLEEGSEMQIVAVTTVSGTTIQAAGERIDEAATLCKPLVLQSFRTGTTVVCDDAVSDDDLSADTYVQQHLPRSLMVMPISHQSKIIGLLYLENSNTTHAFTPDRTQILHMLSSHMAVSLENARLYREQQQLTTSFARFVPTEFLESLNKHSVSDVRLGDAVRRTMTVMFADIRRFTSLSEHMNVDDNFRFLNSYLQFIEPDVYSHGGFIDKYIGDAVMALFPGGADAAVKAAIAMQHSIARYNVERRRQGQEAIDVGIGLHTGEVMLGTVGSAHRMDTTAIGDTVNLASRVENLTKSTNSPVLITGATFDALEHPSQFVTRRVGEETVRGRSEALTIYEVIIAS